MSTLLNYTFFYGDRPINILQLNPRNVSRAGIPICHYKLQTILLNLVHLNFPKKQARAQVYHDLDEYFSFLFP